MLLRAQGAFVIRHVLFIDFLHDSGVKAHSLWSCFGAGVGRYGGVFKKTRFLKQPGGRVPFVIPVLISRKTPHLSHAQKNDGAAVSHGVNES